MPRRQRSSTVLLGTGQRVTTDPRPPALSEKRWQAQVVSLATALGWRVRHDAATNAPRRCSACGEVRRLPRNAPGALDLILIRRPRIVWAELKTDDGKLTPEQEREIDDLRACGQEVWVWRPGDLDSIAKVLSR